MVMVVVSENLLTCRAFLYRDGKTAVNKLTTGAFVLSFARVRLQGISWQSGWHSRTDFISFVQSVKRA